MYDKNVGTQVLPRGDGKCSLSIPKFTHLIFKNMYQTWHKTESEDKKIIARSAGNAVPGVQKHIFTQSYGAKKLEHRTLYGLGKFVVLI